MQTPGGARVLDGGEVLGVAQSRFFLAQAQKPGACGGGFKSETVPQRASEGRVLPQDFVKQSEPRAGGEKGGLRRILRLRFEARPCRKRLKIHVVLRRRGLDGPRASPARRRRRRRAGRWRRGKRL